jgi:hypothetical protein
MRGKWGHVSGNRLTPITTPSSIFLRFPRVHGREKAGAIHMRQSFHPQNTSNNTLNERAVRLSHTLEVVMQVSQKPRKRLVDGGLERVVSRLGAAWNDLLPMEKAGAKETCGSVGDRNSSTAAC